MKRRPVDPPNPADGLPIMPRHLVALPNSAAEHAQQGRARAQWLREHGVNPGDWSKVAPILQDSRRAHGIYTSALDRAARRRVQRPRRTKA